MSATELTLPEKLFINLQHILPRVALSRAMGFLGDSQVPWIKNTFIDFFCNRYPINLSEAEYSDPHAYSSFNEFFTRALKPDARPFAADKDALISPCDGYFLEQSVLKTHPQQPATLTAKGHHFTLRTLLAEQDPLIERFEDGHASIIYLAPHNYHRVHMPCDGRLLSMIHVPGTLYSVNNTTVRGVPGVFARNERVICTFDTEHGWIAVILVGALIVGSIATTWSGIVAPRRRQVTTTHYDPACTARTSTLTLQQGQEMGRFLMGSTVILLTERDNLQWSPTLKPDTPVQLGQPLANWLNI